MALSIIKDVAAEINDKARSVRPVPVEKFDLEDFKLKLETSKKNGDDPWKTLDEFDVDYTLDYPPRRCTLDIGGEGVFPIGNIVGIQAKYKNGKSTLACLFSAALLGNQKFGVRSLIQDAKVIIFDTEQEMSDSVAMGQTINKMLGRECSRNYTDLKVKHIRQQQPVENWEYIKLVSEWMRPTAIVIDGINDLVFAPNDEETSIKVIADMNAFAERNEMVIFGIIHENKSDNNPQGFMGTQLLKKAADIVKVEFDEKTKDFRVSQLFARGHAKFPEFYFTRNNDGVPVETIHQPAPASTNKIYKEIESVLQKVFEDGESFSWADLKKKYMEAAKVLGFKVGDKTAQNRIKTATFEMNLLNKDDEIYSYNDNQPF